MYAFWKGPIIIFIGSVSSLMIFKGIIRPQISGLYYWGSRILLILAIIIRTKTYMFYTKYAGEYISALIIAITVVLSFGQKGPLIRILTSIILMRIGVLSFSLYIWQQLFVGTNTWRPWMRYLYVLPLWQLILFKILVIFGISFFSYRYEWRFLKSKEKFKYSKRMLPA